MIPPFVRSLFFLVEIWRLVGPLLAKKTNRKVPLNLKEGVLFVLLNWDMIWKFLEKQRWTIDVARKIFRRPPKF